MNYELWYESLMSTSLIVPESDDNDIERYVNDGELLDIAYEINL